MQVGVLIQNVSEQCIPNLCAVRSFRPRRVLWVSSERMRPVLLRLQEVVAPLVEEQSVVEIDPRDMSGMMSGLQQALGRLPADAGLFYHLTGGTKSMALVGLEALRRLPGGGRPLRAVVMDPVHQHFDELYPDQRNRVVACARLEFSEILQVHGSALVDDSGMRMTALRGKRELLEKLRALQPLWRRSLPGASLCSADEAGRSGGFYFLKQQGRPLDDPPGEFRHALRVAQQIGVIRGLEFERGRLGRFRFTAVREHDPWAYIRNKWMEDWVAAVLAEADDGEWRGGYASVRIGMGEDRQEFDFLGARRNHLVYWSCKNTSQIKSDHLFEIDALRDEVGGRDRHVAGLLHSARLTSGLASKAGRLNIRTVCVGDGDAAEQLVAYSLGRRPG